MFKILFFLCVSTCIARNTQTNVDFHKQFSPKDYIYNLKDSPVRTTGTGGTIQVVDLGVMPSLAGQGV